MKNNRELTARVMKTSAHIAVLILAVLITGFFFAEVEIQIEGAHGWATSLPTWRVEHHPLLDVVWGGRPLTGYHVWVFSFMALVFHLPLAIWGAFSWRLEARILGCLMIFWITEDFLWFILNPAYGWSKLTPTDVSWHKHWLLGVPTDYITFVLVGAGLVWWSFWHAQKKGDV